MSTALLTAPSKTQLLSKTEPNAELLEKISSFDFTNVIARYSELHLSSDAQEAHRQFCVFVYLSLATGQTLFMPSRIADDFWHVALIFTHDWQAFSNKVAGKFIHHVPLMVEPTFEYKEAQLDQFRTACVNHFGEVNVTIDAFVCNM
jgi:hypothetical protein